MSYLQTYALELAPDKSGRRGLRLNGVTYYECRAMASGLAELYGRPVKLTIVREASQTEIAMATADTTRTAHQPTERVK